MTIESMKKTHFSERTYEDWRLAAETALKGKPLDEALRTQTIEGITLEPLYTKEMFEKRGIAAAGQAAAVQNGKRLPGWFVAQETAYGNAAEFLTAAKEELARGNDMIVYSSLKNLHWTETQLEELAGLLITHPMYFKLGSDDNGILQVFDFIEKEQLAHVQGVIQAEFPMVAPPNVRTLLVDTTPVHGAGGTIIHELGVALSMLAETMEAGSFSEQASKIWVRFAVDTQFFQEIAKLRAFRVLWNAFCEAYGEKAPAIPVFTETSVRSYSKLDPYVNLLRAGNSTFSAVLGGTNAHTVHPHDFLTGPSQKSRRIARNAQLVIKEEAHAAHVLDASAGSYFIESLTQEYVEAAWNYFLEIEEAGGYAEVMQSGWLADDMQAKWLERKNRIAQRSASLIGTNVYADPQEVVKDGAIDESHLEYITAKRLAAPFEKMRALSKELILKTAIIHLAPLKTVKAQSDFVVGFLAVAGIEPLISPQLESAMEVNRFLSENHIDYAVLCGPPEIIESVLPGLETSATIDAAGRIPKERSEFWSKNGITESIYNGKHINSKLEAILSLGKEAF